MYAYAVRWPLLAALVVAAPVFAQTVAQSAAQPAVPKYESAFTGYQPYRDEKPANWRDVNDTAAVLGGHNAHLRDIVTGIDPAAGRVRIDGDGVKELGWPAGTGFWLLKSPELAGQVKPGDRVVFKLEKIGDAYRIASFEHNAPPAPKKENQANPHAGHNMGDKK